MEARPGTIFGVTHQKMIKRKPSLFYDASTRIEFPSLRVDRDYRCPLSLL
jgi:hypothetical protein